MAMPFTRLNCVYLSIMFSILICHTKTYSNSTKRFLWENSCQPAYLNPTQAEEWQSELCKQLLNVHGQLQSAKQLQCGLLWRCIQDIAGQLSYATWLLQRKSDLDLLDRDDVHYLVHVVDDIEYAWQDLFADYKVTFIEYVQDLLRILQKTLKGDHKDRKVILKRHNYASK